MTPGGLQVHLVAVRALLTELNGIQKSIKYGNRDGDNTFFNLSIQKWLQRNGGNPKKVLQSYGLRMFW